MPNPMISAPVKSAPGAARQRLVRGAQQGQPRPSAAPVSPKAGGLSDIPRDYGGKGSVYPPPLEAAPQPMAVEPQDPMAAVAKLRPAIARGLAEGRFTQEGALNRQAMFSRGELPGQQPQLATKPLPIGQVEQGFPVDGTEMDSVDGGGLQGGPGGAPPQLGRGRMPVPTGGGGGMEAVIGPGLQSAGNAYAGRPGGGGGGFGPFQGPEIQARLKALLAGGNGKGGMQSLAGPATALPAVAGGGGRGFSRPAY